MRQCVWGDPVPEDGWGRMGADDGGSNPFVPPDASCWEIRGQRTAAQGNAANVAGRLFAPPESLG
jgi:hypothetical protein